MFCGFDVLFSALFPFSLTAPSDAHPAERKKLRGLSLVHVKAAKDTKFSIQSIQDKALVKRKVNISFVLHFLILQTLE